MVHPEQIRLVGKLPTKKLIQCGLLQLDVAGNGLGKMIHGEEMDLVLFGEVDKKEEKDSLSMLEHTYLLLFSMLAIEWHN